MLGSHLDDNQILRKLALGVGPEIPRWTFLFVVFLRLYGVYKSHYTKKFHSFFLATNRGSMLWFQFCANYDLLSQWDTQWTFKKWKNVCLFNLPLISQFVNVVSWNWWVKSLC